MTYDTDDAPLRAISHIIKKPVSPDMLPEMVFMIYPERIDVSYQGHGGYITRKDAQDWDTSLAEIAKALRGSRMESMSFIARRQLTELENIFSTGSPPDAGSEAAKFMELVVKGARNMVHKHFNVRFDNRFGNSATIFIDYADLPKGSPHLDVLNNPKNLMLGVDGFDKQGNLAGSKLKLKKVKSSYKIPKGMLRGASGKPDAIARKIVQMLLAVDELAIESANGDIDDAIDEWHDSDSDLPLHEYLSMTEAQYARVVCGTRMYVDPNPQEDALTEQRRIMGIVEGNRYDAGRRDGMAASHAVLQGWAKRPKNKEGWLKLAREYGDADEHPQGNLWWKGFNSSLQGQGLD